MNGNHLNANQAEGEEKKEELENYPDAPIQTLVEQNVLKVRNMIENRRRGNGDSKSANSKLNEALLASMYSVVQISSI